MSDYGYGLVLQTPGPRGSHQFDRDLGLIK